MISKARFGDAETIISIVNHFAAQELMLARSLQDVYEHLRDFFVYREAERILGCAALHICWDKLAEIRSLAVLEEAQRKGIGAALVEACLEEARALGAQKVFTLTYVPEFFRRFGFRDYPKEKLPHKVWADCLRCPKFPNCDEQSLIVEL